MGKVKRAEIVNPARKIGRSDAIKKRQACFASELDVSSHLETLRDMVAGSKRRAARETTITRETE